MSDELVTSEAPAGGPSSAPAAQPAAPSPVAATPAAPAGPQSTPATPSVPDGYVPGYRLREAREAAIREATTRHQGEVAQIRAELDRYRQQVQALVGVTPQRQSEADSIKAQLYQVVPFLKTLEDRFGDIEGLVEKASDLDQQANHYWTSYGRQTMDRLFGLASESLGAPLTDEGKRALHASFVGFVQSSPELSQRYANDPSIVEDFWKTITQTLVEPARRTTAAGVQTRAASVARLPQDTPSGAVAATPAPKPQNLDERVAQAWLAFNATKSGG